AILAGKELADLTRSPGPKAAPAYLDKQLNEHRDKKLKLTELIEQVSKGWLKEFKPAKDFLDLAPVSFLLSSVADGLNSAAAVQLAKRQLANRSKPTSIVVFRSEKHMEAGSLKFRSLLRVLTANAVARRVFPLPAAKFVRIS